MMKQETINTFINEMYSASLEKNYPTNKRIITFIDDFWCSDLLDFVEYGPSNSKGYRYILVGSDNFSKYG